MGLPTVSSMLLGAVLSWALLAPLANHMHWAAGPVDDWKKGAQGWVLWVSLAIMMADTLVSFVVAVLRVLGLLAHPTEGRLALAPDDKHESLSAPAAAHKPRTYTVPGLLAAVVVCVASIHYLFGRLVPLYACIVATGLALGETDLNPVSGIGKLSQLVFAVLVPANHPGSVLINLIAGAVAEAGAQQAGDLMQDLKTGQLLNADVHAQLVAQLVGSVYSVVLSAAVYKLYNRAYEIPGPTLRVPTAIVWMDCARLVTGESLPPMARPFALGFALLFAVLSFVKQVYGAPGHTRLSMYARLIPSGVAVGVGMYNTPPFTVARFVGGALAFVWTTRHPTHSDRVILVILASGLILGEGVFSIATLFLTLSQVRPVSNSVAGPPF